MKKNKLLLIINSILLITLIFSFGINQYLIAKTHESLGIKKDLLTRIIKDTLTMSDENADGLKLSGNVMDDAIKLTISQGAPEIYGEELGITFNEVQAAINIMRKYDPGYGKAEKITLGLVNK